MQIAPLTSLAIRPNLAARLLSSILAVFSAANGCAGNRHTPFPAQPTDQPQQLTPSL